MKKKMVLKGRWPAQSREEPFAGAYCLQAQPPNGYVPGPAVKVRLYQTGWVGFEAETCISQHLGI